MTVLGIEGSARSAGVAILKDDTLVAENYLNCGLTHSVTILPMVDALLSQTGLKLSDMDILAVSKGPGSFTGLRIAAATVKGLAGDAKKCVGVSTLEAMAYNHTYFDGIVCAVMDARCSQVYNALFEMNDGKLRRLCEDRAIMTEELEKEIKKLKKSVLLIGDGANLCYNIMKDKLKNVSLAPENCVFEHAYGVCRAAAELVKNGFEPTGSQELLPEYLRLPQAQRELNKKENKK